MHKLFVSFVLLNVHFGGKPYRSWLGHYDTSRRSRVGFAMWSLDFSVDLILPAALWPRGRRLGLLTELSAMNLLVDKGRLALKADTTSPPVSRLTIKCGSLDVSEPYRRPRPVTGIALLTFPYKCTHYIVF
jgi:hypothetical protein